MSFLECEMCIPRSEMDQEEKELAIREIKRKVGLLLDGPKSAATIGASNQSADKALHITTLTDRSPKSSANKTKSGRVTKPPSSKKRIPQKPRRKMNEQRV
jgi:predicted NUDIX family NTP pyrophosphohydrolase